MKTPHQTATELDRKERVYRVDGCRVLDHGPRFCLLERDPGNPRRNEWIRWPGLSCIVTEPDALV